MAGRGSHLAGPYERGGESYVYARLGALDGTSLYGYRYSSRRY